MTPPTNALPPQATPDSAGANPPATTLVCTGVAVREVRRRPTDVDTQNLTPNREARTTMSAPAPLAVNALRDNRMPTRATSHGVRVDLTASAVHALRDNVVPARATSHGVRADLTASAVNALRDTRMPARTVSDGVWADPTATTAPEVMARAGVAVHEVRGQRTDLEELVRSTADSSETSLLCGHTELALDREVRT